MSNQGITFVSDWIDHHVTQMVKDTIDLTGEVNVYTGLLKVAYDFGEGPFTPFIAAGIGLAQLDVEIDAPVTGTDDTLALAGALEAGVSYAMTANAELFASAQALLLDDVTLDPTATGDSH